jgi:hypothetical protein
MNSNLAGIDRALRLVLAALGWWLAAAIGYASPGGVIVLVLAGILAITAALGYCPLYTLLRISTRGGLHHVAHP